MDDRFLHLFCIICWTDYKDCKKSLIITETMTQTNVDCLKVLQRNIPHSYLLFVILRVWVDNSQEEKCKWQEAW